jgi:hypothetical protein
MSTRERTGIRGCTSTTESGGGYMAVKTHYCTGEAGHTGDHHWHRAGGQGGTYYPWPNVADNPEREARARGYERAAALLREHDLPGPAQALDWTAKEIRELMGRAR